MPEVTAHPLPVTSIMTHEQFIHEIRDIAVIRLNDKKLRSKIRVAKLVYGSGRRGVRGTCFYDAWDSGEQRELIEICAFGEESHIQLAGTTLHELAHGIAGRNAGHGSAWKRAAQALGLIRAQAAGQEYMIADFHDEVWAKISELPIPTDGRPALPETDFFTARRVTRIQPCRAGIGTRGGRSHGPGSGRLRLFLCACEKPVRVRVASDSFNARCLTCQTDFRHESEV